MPGLPQVFGAASGPGGGDPSSSLASLFHRLNNQLGIILANAELLEARLTDETSRARAAQIAASVVEAMGTARELRSRINEGR